MAGPMSRGGDSGLERAIDGLAATLFALCAAWSLHASGITAMAAVGVAAIGGAVALACLRRVGRAADEPGFALAEPEFDEPVDDTLLLEDRLIEPAGDSQVVRLFAVGAGYAPQVPGELAERIDHFLDGARPALRAVPAQPDAAQELYEALAEIRRTLR